MEFAQLLRMHPFSSTTRGSRLSKLIIALASGLAVLLSASVASAATRSGSSVASSHGLSGPGSARRLGLGLTLGEPTGVDLKYWISRQRTVEFGAAYSFDDSFELLGDYSWNFPQVLSGGHRLIPSIGIGGALFVDSVQRRRLSPLALALRIPFELEYMPNSVPIGVFVELTPGLGLFPGTFGFFQGNVGARFYL